MQIRLTFLGAAQNVTGSRYLIETDKARLLVDCGLYQERDLKGRNWETFTVPPKNIDAVLLTHAHLDHCGLLPKLAREGFRGSIYCTAATCEITEIVLLDAGHIQEEDAAFKKKRHAREGRKARYPEIPLYTADDARDAIPLLKSVRYGKTIEVARGIEASFHDAGHILGSSMIKLVVSQDGEKRTIIFSGDVGRWDKPVLRDPTVFAEADYVLVESTYGDREVESLDNAINQLPDVINAAVEAGGNIIIPSFAVARSQDMLYYLNKFLMEDRIPHLMVFLDSPMAVNVTEVFEHHPDLYDEEMTQLICQGKSPFAFPGLKLVRTTAESKAINHIKASVIIMAGSGMCTAGRIKHHLVTNISRPESTILFPGYQAGGTLGRQIVDGAKEVRILGQYYPVRARIVRTDGLSAHADKNELLKWLSGLQKPPRGVFVTHGEATAAQTFASSVRERFGWEVAVPAYQEEVLLD